jgi:8-oxo-dGTP pyrophosphatase MutT (NUDIX family)
MATQAADVCDAFSKTLPAWIRFQQNAERVGGTVPRMLACHAFGKSDADVLSGTATRGFAFGSVTQGFPQSVLVRGDAAAVLIVLRSQEDPSQEFGVFVRQPRVAVGRTDLLELVAGMLDRTRADDRICLADAIRKEVEEETGQTFAPEEFINLSKWQRLHARGRPGFLPSDDLTEGSPTSPGGCDECIHFFAVVKTLPLRSILSLRGIQRGNAQEHERTLVTLLPLHDALFVCTDVKFLSAWTLFQAWQRSCVMPSHLSATSATPGLTMMGLRCTRDGEGRRVAAGETAADVL